MSRMKDVHLKAQEFLHLGNEINRLEKKREELRAELGRTLNNGDTVVYKGEIHEWEEYHRSSTSWKQLYSQATPMLDDEAAVIMGEAERKMMKKSGPFYRFITKKT